MKVKNKGIYHERSEDAPFIGALICADNCTFNCPGCINDELKKCDGTYAEDTEIIQEVLSNPFNQGIILGGLEWTLQPFEMLSLIDLALENNLQVMLYTGLNKEQFVYNFPTLLHKNIYVKCGRYDAKQAVTGYKSCGVLLASSNQEIIQTGEYMRTRGFELVSEEQYKKSLQHMGYNSAKYEDLKLPQRETPISSGYDFHSPIAFELYPGDIIKIPTGVRSYMQDDEELKIYVRSSMGFNYNIRLLNQVGKIDSDYYLNEKNEGHIFIGLKNEGDQIWEVKIGERIGQGSFYKYLLADNDKPAKEKRTGGIGSTGK